MATILLMATDRRQARTLMQYVRALLRVSPMVQQLIVAETAEAIELSTGCRIEIGTAHFARVRGYSVPLAIFDECAFWSDDTGANPATEIYTATKPAMATFGRDALLVAISSPYARTGLLWNLYRGSFGKDDAERLVIQAPSLALNPSLDPRLVARELEQDPARAGAEWEARFRDDVESYVRREAVEACVISGRFELPKLSNVTYSGFCDPSGGSADSMTLGIAHREKRGDVHVVLLDCIREIKPPFSPDQVVERFAEILRRYGIHRIEGDRYSGDFVRELFRKRGISYEPSARTKSELYGDLLGMLNSGQVELLDAPKLVAQLCGVERRTSRGGRESIDHVQGGHDDLANAAAGAVVLAGKPRCIQIFFPGSD